MIDPVWSNFGFCFAVPDITAWLTLGSPRYRAYDATDSGPWGGYSASTTLKPRHHRARRDLPGGIGPRSESCR